MSLLQKGKIIKTVGNTYFVNTENNTIIECYLKGKFRMDEKKSTSPVVIGDLVSIELEDNADKGCIVSLDERKNYIIRRATNWSKQVHIIAANIDQAILIASYKEPATTTDFIDRFLVTAEAYNIKAIVIFNKSDLLNDDEHEKLNQTIKLYNSIGYKSFKCAIKESYNLDLIIELMKSKVTLLTGNSGVGKSSLINIIDPTLRAKTSDISSVHGTGMHTTSYSEMYQFDEDSFIIDTPGIKSFGVVDFEKSELFHYFPEIFKVAKECKYYNCLHVNEPDCKVKEAVINYTIAESRYNSYLNLFYDDKQKYR